ncbi:High osmolarity signaling protein SHO1A [Fulvia fulva]|uniref:High osmolarity signaling protein SHO1A n=1 Tax=Passalora fulva TaxID=5499 RepID=A0A9Q8LHN3_PASFU|nr:High osmolarity signaling protein SHO1A [Fulvia fulva]KAK4624125.1 High osmolarity signaling protein SHO1A [Fulvia fulva]KAK4625730.1 High osmolarity signaling protein SHO1A [Fulvia fulva]UJO17606.1 High osmolarity signaling protein SHO1A [Fulvia fulva]WPV15193.1 High osmolarity signaling protein SHO1A [Fulvia fulva]WPV29950.1 High osmolarity signaling protein SHO1A [Fulvia fulva]
MPSFGGSDNSSPALQKMDMGNGGRYAAKRFDFGHIAGDPFWLGTIGIGISGWIIAFVSSIIADLSQEYPNYSWWSLVYMFFCIIAVLFVVGANAVFTYHVAIAAFLSAGLVFTTSSVNSLIYYPDPAKEAAAAGFILLSIVSIIWIFYFGSQPQASHRQTLDSFALHKDRAPSRNSRAMRQSYRPETTHSGGQQPQAYNTNRLAGFETVSPVAGYHGGPAGQANRDSEPRFSQPLNSQPSGNNLAAHNGASLGVGAGQGHDSSVSAPSDYPYRAKAIYSYEANPDDANEISFTKHEILEVSDVSGRWWQAKKENGETGIAPSNYLILL